MNSPSAPATVTSGLRDTGPGIPMPRIITGFREHGCCRRKSATCGLPRGGGGWDDGVCLFHDGFWGPHIGFYGGINYGFGYFGVGFVGGRWDGGHFFYNRDVANINVVDIHNVYNEHENITENHISYNGGQGGITARPRPEDEVADHDRHVAAVSAQTEHITAARGNHELRPSGNKGNRR